MKESYYSALVAAVSVTASILLFYLTGLILWYIVLGILFAIDEFTFNDNMPLKRRIVVSVVVGLSWFPCVVEYIYKRVTYNV